jgi:hypothetical protein
MIPRIQLLLSFSQISFSLNYNKLSSTTINERFQIEPVLISAITTNGGKNWRKQYVWRITRHVILIAFKTVAFHGHIDKVEVVTVGIVNGVIEGFE